MTISNIHLLNHKLLLYAVSPSLVEQYKQIMQNYSHLLSQPQQLEHKPLNVFITVCDIWIALKTNDEPIVLDQNKCMSFPPAALQLKLIEENSTLKNFLGAQKLSPEQQFILSYFISLETMNWIQQIMRAADRYDLVEHYLEYDLFEHHNEDTFLHETNNQTVFVKIMMKNIRETNEFHFAITAAISKTKDFLKQLAQ